MVKLLKNKRKQLKIKKKTSWCFKSFKTIEDQKQKQIEAIKGNKKQLFDFDDSEKRLRQKQLLMSYLMKEWVKYIT